MDLENVFLTEELRRKQLEKSEATEKKLREQVAHLLRYAYSDNKCSEKDAR